ncbi:hypothetical protein TBLA_0D04190 [Henningerozyma blattae CBS 6284]|uniref:NADH-cytochrome b5 reductase n=1 Tax=Henningerozyma blattae (strain ATCC 34711 / CBS 6284 / DSM 70876 / NBRC 10599 / NRRL Y-10934 / UCD 77-7) TaxID=1071380 RepID=I2H3G4_HENB6|nr:hypothetical protein TBLA_0D04190 [Tetrapisispora blattae CBS 6284]CCH60916.1 hypothetical protein TBLA_0D04190 [Tetrapisispora blattae CBS 6284]
MSISPVLFTLILIPLTFLIYKNFIKNSQANGNNKTKNNNEVLDGSDEVHSFPLISKIVMSKSTSIYRFGLPNETDVLGLPIGQHISIKAPISEGKFILRSYTPITLDSMASGYFELLVKTYTNGVVSTYLNDLKIGDYIQVVGPRGNYSYQRNMKSRIGMIAGGTGIAPMYQIMKAIAMDPNDNTKVNLVYGSLSIDNILLKKELDELVEQRPNQFKVHYLVDRIEEPEIAKNWEGSIGYISPEIMKDHLPVNEKSNKNQILICGPPRMVSSIKRYVTTLGYERPKGVSKGQDPVFVFKFQICI